MNHPSEIYDDSYGMYYPNCDDNHHEGITETLGEIIKPNIDLLKKTEPVALVKQQAQQH